MTRAEDTGGGPRDVPTPEGGAPHVLLVDDDPTFRRAMAKALGRKGFSVSELGGGAAAIAALGEESAPADVVLLDLQMPDVSGMQVLRRTPRRRPKVIVLTGHGTVPDAVEAMRLGAFSFLLKPIDADELVPVLKQALAAGRTARDQLVGESLAMQHLRQTLDSFAPAADAVLLTGETGTGKEVATTYLHQRSRRAAQPLVAINLSCLPRELVESELFGHARGAFTGAERRKRGLFAEAGQGTLFLDEVSELPLELQPKLLRALEVRMFRPVGETREEPLQAGLICATNRDLRTLVKQGRFREDLYYRLAVLPVFLPPLREHPEDVVPIAEHWLNKIVPAIAGPNLSAGAGSLRFSEDACAALRAHDYPGNVRELVNIVRRVALFVQPGVTEIEGSLVRRMLAEDPFRSLRSELLPVAQPVVPSVPPPPAAAAQATESGSSPLVSGKGALIGSAAATEGPLSLRELELRHIERLLREHKNITMVAKLLDIDRRTLQRKLRSLGIPWQKDQDE